MKRGKKICETLKAIRQDIANANDIDYQTTECTHEGDCAGTCPKCESEVRWLERQLRARQALGKAVTIAGLSMALGALSSCNSCNSTPPDAGDVPNIDTTYCTPEDSTTDVDGYLDDSEDTVTMTTEHRFTPLRNNDKVEPKGNNDDEIEQVMGEVAVDENGNIGEL